MKSLLKTINPFYDATKEPIRKRVKERAPLDLEQTNLFFLRFPDFEEFNLFIKETVVPTLPEREVPIYSNLTEEFFTTEAPIEYNLLNIPEDKYSDTANPFYFALRYTFSIIPHFNPSVKRVSRSQCTEHFYMITLNRLIYYYNVLLAINKNRLLDKESTAVCFIYAHGSYHNPDGINENIVDIDKLGTVKDMDFPSEPSSWSSLGRNPGYLENLFICSKSAMGVISCAESTVDGKFKTVMEDAFVNGSMQDTMNTVSEKGFVSFDKIIKDRSEFVANKRIPLISSTASLLIADCKIEDTLYGRSMQHYIIPETKKFINKSYQCVERQNANYLIDLSRFVSEMKKLEHVPDTSEERTQLLDKANILMDPQFKKNLQRFSRTVESVYISLADIVYYYSIVKGIRNLFIYDTSCSSISYNPEFIYFNKLGILASLVSSKGYVGRTLLKSHVQLAKTLANTGFGSSRKPKKISNAYNIMAHHKSHRRRRTMSHRRKYRHRTRNNKRRTSRKTSRSYKSRGGNGLNGYAPADYSPTGTINPAVMVPPNYIEYNKDVSAIPFGVSTTNPPLPPSGALL